MAEENVESAVEEQPVELTDEELDRIADTAIGALQDILKYFDVGEVTIDEYEGDDGELILDITGDDLAVLIGRHGKTLDASVHRIGNYCAYYWISLSGRRRCRRIQGPPAREARIYCSFICQSSSGPA